MSPPRLEHSRGALHSFWLIKNCYKTCKAKHCQTPSESCIGNQGGSYSVFTEHLLCVGPFPCLALRNPHTRPVGKLPDIHSWHVACTAVTFHSFC